MGNVIIIKNKEFDYDVVAYEKDKPVKKAWAMNKQQAYGMADILANHFTDENGQRAGIVYNELNQN